MHKQLLETTNLCVEMKRHVMGKLGHVVQIRFRRLM